MTIKRNFTYWRNVYRTASGWRGVRRCFNCLYGPIAWKRSFRKWNRDNKLRKMFEAMTPDERNEFIRQLRELAND